MTNATGSGAAHTAVTTDRERFGLWTDTRRIQRRAMIAWLYRRVHQRPLLYALLVYRTKLYDRSVNCASHRQTVKQLPATCREPMIVQENPLKHKQLLSGISGYLGPCC